MTKLKKSIVCGVLGLLAVLSSCSKNEPIGSEKSVEISTVSADVGKYETVSLSVSTDMEATEEQDAARASFYETTQNGKPFAKFSFGIDGNKLYVYTTIVRVVGGKREVIFSDNLQWTILKSGRALRYEGALKIAKIRPEGQTTDPTLELVAIPNDGTLKAQKDGSFVFEADTEFRSLPIEAVSYTTAVPHNSAPYVMHTKLKRKATQGPDARTLTVADLSIAKFKPQGNLVRFRVTNKTGAPVRLEGVGRPPYYIKDFLVAPLNGKPSQLGQIYDPSPTVNAQEYYYTWKIAGGDVIIPTNQTSRIFQLWVPVYFPINPKMNEATNRTYGAFESKLNIYHYPTSGANANKRRKKTVSLSTTSTSNEQKLGKQLFYDVTLVASDMKLNL